MSWVPVRRRGWDNADLPFPQYRHYPMNDSTEPTAFRTWMCVVCGFIYDEAEGIPDEGIAPGTRWEDVPDTWTCPDCGVTKDDFEMMTL
ncbi:rubredoxin [Proluteimonas luteida]|uniref:rubredoxin n=1 Tax=Proluteimonas luteida TaxID=2878685 RepID=UPI003F49C983